MYQIHVHNGQLYIIPPNKKDKYLIHGINVEDSTLEKTDEGLDLVGTFRIKNVIDKKKD